MGVADGDGAVAALLGRGRRVINFGYGAERTVGALLERAISTIDAAGAEQFDVIGLSIGGWFAQCLAARPPHRVRRLVLGHSFMLRPEHRWRFSIAIALWPLLPRALVRAGVTKRARLALAPLRKKDLPAYEAAMRTLITALSLPATRAGLVAQQHAIRDSLQSPLEPFPPLPMLIIDSNTDPLIRSEERDRLRRAYPWAQHVEIVGAGHASALVEPEAFARAVDSFLRG